jgi:hypothetical protein
LNGASAGVRFAGQLAYSGNWEMRSSRYGGYGDYTRLPLDASLGMRFDFGDPLRIEAGQSFAAPPAAFTVSSGDMGYRHPVAYYGWLDGLRQAHPNLVIQESQFISRPHRCPVRGAQVPRARLGEGVGQQVLLASVNTPRRRKS